MPGCNAAVDVFIKCYTLVLRTCICPISPTYRYHCIFPAALYTRHVWPAYSIINIFQMFSIRKQLDVSSREISPTFTLSILFLLLLCVHKDSTFSPLALYTHQLWLAPRFKRFFERVYLLSSDSTRWATPWVCIMTWDLPRASLRRGTPRACVTTMLELKM